ncbi:MAG: TolC family protein [Candidatus Lustribacter sp.]|jgi:HAE1 family hydrophobic/amphiphilic exporter-1
MFVRLLAGMLGISVVLCSAGFPVAAQPTQPAPSVPSAQPIPPAQLPSPGAPSSPQPQASQPAQAAGEALPPPPVPAVMPSVPNVAPGYAGPANPPLPNGELVGVNQPFVGIGLQDAITMALQRNTDLAISQSNLRIANYQIVAAKGAYDVQFQLEPQYSHSVQPATSPFESGPGGGPITQISDGVSAAFTGMTTSGGRYSLTGSQQAIQNNAQLNSYNPFYQTALALNFTQPLLRGAGAGSPIRRQLTIASANARAQTAQVLTQASQTVTNVSNTYWDLVAAWRDVAIQEEGLRNAQAQAASNARLAQRGAAAPVDVIESNTQINVFQDNVFSALQRVQQLQTQLKSLILASPADPLWVANLVPTSPVLQLPAEPKLDDLMMTALRNRPELAQLRAQRLVAAANLAYAKNQLLPQLDLGVGITANGFSGVPNDLTGTPFFQTLGGEISSLDQLIDHYNATALPAEQIPLIVPNFGTTPAYESGTLGQSWNNLFDFRFPTYSISLTLQFPIGNRTAKADYAIAQEQAKQVAVQELALLQRVRSESVNAIQTLREAQYRLAAATAARIAAQRVLLSEQRRFAAGTSTTFLVLQRQLDVANNEGRELQAQTDLNEAVVQLDAVAGTNFADYNIDVQSVGTTTLNVTAPTTSVLPLPPDAQVSPPPPHR